MKISEFPRAMRQILGKGNKYYVSKNNFNQLEEVSKIPLIEDQGPTDDVISQEQKPKTFYPDDSVMPSFDGMEDPKALEDYRQMELADGGVVEREGFAEGTNIQKEFLFDFIKENQGVSSKVKADKLNKLGYINSKGGPITKTMLNAFITKNPELKGQGKSVVSSLEDLEKEASPKQLSDFKSDLIDESTFRNRVVRGRGDKKRTPEYTRAASARKYKRVMADPKRKAVLKETQARFIKKNYLEKGMFPSARTPKDAFWRDLVRAADKKGRISWISERPNRFPTDVFKGLELMDNKTGKKITYNNLPNHPEYSKTIKTYEKKYLINQLDIPYDIKKKITYQRKPGGVTNNIVIQHNEGIGKNPFNISIATQFENSREDKIKNKFNKNFNKAKTLTEKKQIVKNFITELSKKTPNIISQPGKKPYGSEKTLSELASKGLDKNELKIFNTALEKLNPSEQKVLTKFGKELKMGFDPTEIINALPEREAQIIRGVGSKIGNIAKLGARGLAELTTGLGPLGIGITAAVTAPFALYDVSQGDRTSEVLQNTVSDLTLGLTPRADERIIRDIGGESAVRGYEIQQNIDKFRTARDDLKNLNEQLNDPSSTLFSEDEDSILASIERNKNIIKETATYLQPFIKEGKLVSPDYNDYLKAANKQTIEKNIRKEMRGFDGGDDYYDIDNTNSELENLKKSQETLEKTYVGNQNKQPGLVGQYFGIVPNRGRVGLRLGGSKKLFNLLKKSKKDKPKKELTEKEVQDIMDDPQPENLDRRDFLKGAGALGLAVAAFGTGALKIAKALKTKTALKVLAKPAAGQPEWFAPLVDKIITKGIYTKNLDKADSISGTYTFKEGDQTLKLIKTEPETFSNGYTYGGDIRIEAEAGGAFDQPFSMTYFPNIKYVTEGQKVSRPGFQVIESRPRYTAVGPGDFDLEDIEYVHSTGGKDVNLLELPKGETGILSDMEGLEKIATGKIKNPKLKKKRQEVNEKLLKNPIEDRAIEYYDGPDIDYDYD